MDGYRTEGGGMGCLTWLLIGACFAAVIATMAGGDSTTTTTTRDTRSGVLSGNQAELLSRNQLNVLSEVWNCFGDNSCIITSELITTTSTTNAPVEIVGDRNTIRYTDAGRPICPNPNDPSQAGDVAEWCAAIGVQMP